MKKIFNLSVTTALLVALISCKNESLTNSITENSIFTSGSGIIQANTTSKRSGAIRGDGIYSDQTELYMSNIEPSSNQSVKIKLRTYKGNVNKATFIQDNSQSIPMKPESQDKLGLFDFWVVNVSTGNTNSRYKFKVENGSDTGWYNAVGFYDHDPGEEYNFWFAPNFLTPDWSKESIYYQIFVDRFNNGNPKNDVKDSEYLFPYPEDPGNPENVKVKAQKWDALPEQPAKNRDFFGGDIEGVRQKLSYLSGLGINTIYFNPIFHSPSNHKYDTQDYRTIDPHFASNEEFKNFVKEAHAKNIKIVIDGVFNHTGSWHRWFDRAGQYETTGAFENQKSEWSDFYNFNNWPSKYISWWNFDTLPKLNYASNKLRGEIYGNKDSIARYWIQNYGVDGWRLDVPNEAGPNGGSDDHTIWREFRSAVKSTKKDAVIIGELWKNASQYLQGDQFDGVMNYEGFADPVSIYMNEGYTIETAKRERISPSQFELWIRSILAKSPTQANQVVMNLLDSHDTSRFVNRAQGDKWKLYEAAIFQMTFIGSPMIYYGDEIAMTGGKDPDCRRPFNWNYNRGEHISSLYKKLTRLRSTNSALRTGTFETLLIDDQNGIFSYGRMDKKNIVLVILNNTSSTKNVTVNVAKLGFDSGTILRDELNNTSLSPRSVTVDANRNIVLPVFGHYGAVLTLVSENKGKTINK